MALFGLIKRRKQESLRPFPSPEGYGQYPEGYGTEKDMNLFGQQAPVINQNLNPASIQQGNYNKDVELILSKLDNIRALLENLNRRLEALERSGQQEVSYGQQNRRRW